MRATAGGGQDGGVAAGTAEETRTAAVGLAQRQGEVFGVTCWSVGHLRSAPSNSTPTSSPAHPTAFPPRSAAWDAPGGEVQGQLVLHPPPHG